MSRSRLLILLCVLVVLVLGVGVGTWAWTRSAPAPAGQSAEPAAPSSPDAASQEDARAAARVAAQLPTRRSESIHPVLTDDPNAVPVYPPNTTIILDEASWQSIGKSASAYAQVEPQNQRVLMHFFRHGGIWHVSQITTEL